MFLGIIDLGKSSLSNIWKQMLAVVRALWVGYKYIKHCTGEAEPSLWGENSPSWLVKFLVEMWALSSLSLRCANAGKTNPGDPGEETAVCRTLGQWPLIQTSGRWRIYHILTAGSFSTMASDVQEEVVPAHGRQKNSKENGGHLSSWSLF